MSAAQCCWQPLIWQCGSCSKGQWDDVVLLAEIGRAHGVTGSDYYVMTSGATN